MSGDLGGWWVKNEGGAILISTYAFLITTHLGEIYYTYSHF